MNCSASAIKSNFKLTAIFARTAEFPLQVSPVFTHLTKFAKHMLPAFMPEHRLAKNHPQRHVIDQRLERARSCRRAKEVRMRPSPEVPMTVTAIMALQAESQRPTMVAFSIKN